MKTQVLIEIVDIVQQIGSFYIKVIIEQGLKSLALPEVLLLREDNI